MDRMPPRHASILLILCSFCISFASLATAADSSPSPGYSPRIESVVPLPKQPQENDPAVIWYDDFNGPDKPYGDGRGNIDPNESFGGSGKSLACIYEKGQQGTGNRKVFFGDYPMDGRIVRKGQTFNDIYWRVYVKHQPGWTGAEAKLSRATSLTSAKWTQAMIAHVWSGSGDSLTLDPASGVRGDKIFTTRYNDFDKLHWLGNHPVSAFRFSSTEESGWWVCIESRAKLNTPGLKDGINQLWIDGRLEVVRDHLDFRGNYTAHGINGVFLEAYWNQGSPVTQTRWIDNFIISTQPIGPVVCPRNPTLIRTPLPSTTKQWQAELAADSEGKVIVWRSKTIADERKLSVDAETGEFIGTLSGKQMLAGSAIYYCRVRDMTGAAAAAWSPWHQCFATEK